MERVTELPAIPPRDAESHKGTYGSGLVLGGSWGMVGAAALCAQAALRAGAGLVTIGAPRSIVPILAAKTTCPTTRAFSETDAKSFAAEAAAEVLEALPDFTALALGPGIGRHPSTCQFVQELIPGLQAPAVIDADGLNNLSADVSVLQQRAAPLVLTPHPGEMARLTGLTTRDVQKDRTAIAERFAGEHSVVVALKGHGTVVTDGARTYVNTTGNPGMATGGSGDVLTGAILGLLCQGFDAFSAAQLGVYLHGLAGDFAAQDKGEVSLIATDILDALPAAFVRHAGAQ